MTYTYGDAGRPDRLTQMAEAGSTTKGFKSASGITGDHYLYDLNGNLTQDKHKGFTIAYNFLNLPVTMTQGANVITMSYTADGEKLSKTPGAGAVKNYVSGIEYSGANVEAIYHGEGRCTPNGATAFYYEYTIRDHLGSARVSFRANGAALTPIQENHYYPFGMEMEGSWLTQVGTENGYEYTGKEINEDFGLNWYDYGARWYDPAVGRWWSVDPMGEKYSGLSGYNYGLDNPIKLLDPDGMQVVDPDGNEICYDQETKEWSSNATEDVKKVGEAMMQTDAGAAAYMKMENAETEITITLTDKALEEGYGFTISKGKTEGGEYKKSDITISTVIPEEGRFAGASEEEYLNAVGSHESVHATATGEQMHLDKTDRNNTYTSEVLPMNIEYESRTEYVKKQNKSPDAIQKSYETPQPKSKNGAVAHPAYYGIDSNGKSKTKSRYEK